MAKNKLTPLNWLRDEFSLKNKVSFTFGSYHRLLSLFNWII